MPFTTSLVQRFGNRWARNTAGTWVATLYLALYKSSPALDGTGGVEFTTADFTTYARQPIGMGAPSGRVFTNDTAALFTTSATMGTPATATHYAIFTALTGGTMDAYTALTSPLLIGSGTPVNFPIGSLTFSDLGTA